MVSTGTAMVASVNVGRPRTTEWFGRRVRSAIWKSPIDGPVEVRGVNLDGDDQADRRVHGGVDKAVYSYAVEDYDWWRDHWRDGFPPVAPGLFGENLTVSGLDLGASVIGDLWHVGTTVLEVAQPRTPCYKLGMRVGDAEFVDLFGEAERPGAYLRIVVPGVVQAGDEIRVEPATEPSVTIGELVADDPSLELLERVVATAAVPDEWRRGAERALRRG